MSSEDFENFSVLRRDLSQPAVLVLGGSKFMGRALVEELLAEKARICIVNRGREYWGTADPAAGRTAHVSADREKVDIFAERLKEATKRLGGDWDMVVDFSAFDGADMRASLAGLGSSFKLYVYISSDSVYEVSTWAAEKWLPPKGMGEDLCVAEDAAVRPSDQKQADALNKKDDYGHEKLQGEEVLLKEIPPQCRCISLRLPDVIGPFDGTHRLWAYWHWLHAGEEGAPAPQIQSYKPSAPGQVPSNPQLSLVYSRDVARFIVELLKRPAPRNAPRCDAVNLCCSEQVPLADLLMRLATASGMPRKRPRFAPNKDPKTYLPSVDRPWPLSLDYAYKVYNFKPTPLDEVLENCASFFKEGCKQFPGEATKAAKKLPEDPADIALKLAGLHRLSEAS